MYNTNLSCRGARELFTAVKENNKLKYLFIAGNAITDDACDVITTALQRNKCLVKLSMSQNSLSSTAIINIAKCLVVNDTLKFLRLPQCSHSIQEDITSLQERVNNERKARGCQVKLGIGLA